jgi:putative transposase
MNEQSQEVVLPNEAFEPIRLRVDIQVGSLVQKDKMVFRISQVLDFETVIGIEVESGRSAPLKIGELRPVVGADATAKIAGQDLADIADEDWKIAEQLLICTQN